MDDWLSLLASVWAPLIKRMPKEHPLGTSQSLNFSSRPFQCRSESFPVPLRGSPRVVTVGFMNCNQGGSCDLLLLCAVKCVVELRFKPYIVFG